MGSAGRSSVLAFIEIPRGSRNKYEYDEELRAFKLDRVLYSSVHYPCDYGWIPDTLGEDGDHLDILVLMQEPTFPGCMIEARPLGGLDMHDEKGSDFKVLAVPIGDPRFDHMHTLDDLGEAWLKEIENLFRHLQTARAERHRDSRVAPCRLCLEGHCRVRGPKSDEALVAPT